MAFCFGRDAFKIYGELWLCNNKANYERHQPWMSRRGRCAWIE
jgi:hypothetical protein